jgi:hypothetical protein
MDYLRVSPASVMHDFVTFKTHYSKRDAVTITTKTQRKGDIITYPSVDEFGLSTSYGSIVPLGSLNTPTLTSESSSTLDSGYINKLDISATTTKLRIRQGLGDGALIIPN